MKAKEVLTKAGIAQSEIRGKIGVSIGAAFALVIALSWNEVIQGLVKNIVTTLGLIGEGLWVKLIAAVFTTIICVIGIHYASKMGQK